MAEVFKAKAFGVEGFERILAIKRILPNMADDDEFINMFVDEARIAVQFSHANIVQIYELGKYENQYYIAMEYVSGRDLRQILDNYRKKKEVLPLPVAAFLVSKICDGLDYAHRKSDPTGKALNLIHRDVSPQNILVSYEGAVKITDFGIAKAEDRASKTQAGVLKGKFGYMSPEQVRGLEIDHRSDIFAVGILVYEMLTNKRLFLGDSDFSTLEKVRNAEVTPPSQHNPTIPAELERIMLKALAKERDERYQWCAELHDDLQQFLIEDNTIFNAKRLAEFLSREYADDIKGEMQKMEEYMRMPPPSSPEALAAAQEARAAPVRTDPGEHHGEKTMIFESGFGDESSPGRGGDEAATGELKAIEPAPRRP
ncbi:MAG: serine/threonine protein kinase, partial [Deltaproteobacteria bacterium]|nr:serine/threonine protein kinase [Deltaproteobacteria bacterium]